MKHSMNNTELVLEREEFVEGIPYITRLLRNESDKQIRYSMYYMEKELEGGANYKEEDALFIVMRSYRDREETYELRQQRIVHLIEDFKVETLKIIKREDNRISIDLFRTNLVTVDDRYKITVLSLEEDSKIKDNVVRVVKIEGDGESMIKGYSISSQFLYDKLKRTESIYRTEKELFLLAKKRVAVIIENSLNEKEIVKSIIDYIDRIEGKDIDKIVSSL